MVLIFGNDYSLTIVLPFVLIMVVVVFFITTYIKDNMSKLKINIRGKKKKEMKVPTNFSREFLKLKKEINSLSTQDSLDEITLLIRTYVSEKLGIDRQLSFEELPRDKLDWPVIEFTKRLSDLKYSGRETTRAEISHLLLYLSKILKVKTFVPESHEQRGIFRFIKIPKIEFKFPKLRRKKHEEIIPAKKIKPLDLGLPKKITINLSWLFRKKDHAEKLELKPKIKLKPEIKIRAPEPEKHEVHHRKKPSVFEKIKVRMHASRVLKLIKKAERKSESNPLLSRKMYNEALLMYYRLPIDKEENIAIKLNRYYEKVNGSHEKELINIKHYNKKETKEALRHLKRYRNYLIIENNSFNNKLRKHLDDVKIHTIRHVGKTKNKYVRIGLNKFLKLIARDESSLFALEERFINNLIGNVGSLLRLISKDESKEAYDEYMAIMRLFSHLKMEHKLPRAPAPLVRHEEIKHEIISPILPVIEEKLPEIIEQKPIRIKPPVVVIKKKVEIRPPKLPERKISDRMKKLMEEKESVYNKLKEVEGKELDRFRHTKRMSTHENIGYHDFLTSFKPKPDVHEEHKMKKLFEAK